MVAAEEVVVEPEVLAVQAANLIQAMLLFQVVQVSPLLFQEQAEVVGEF